MFVADMLVPVALLRRRYWRVGGTGSAYFLDCRRHARQLNMQSRTYRNYITRGKIMNIRTATTFTVVAFAAAASALGSRAADHEAACEPQGRIHDSYPRSASMSKPQTAHQIAETRWLELERQRGSVTFAPVPFPPPPNSAVVSNDPPAAPVQNAQNSSWEEERQLDDGYAWPAPRIASGSAQLACESIGANIARKRDGRTNTTVFIAR
jgi:hypothetical protein